MPSYTTSMEKSHYGIAPDADENSAGYSLDFAGMLDATDSALHNQIYEYFQGPGLHQSEQFVPSQEQSGGFPSGVFPGPPPFPSLPPFQSLSAEPFQATSFLEQRMVPDTLHHLSRRDGSVQGGKYGPSDSRRKQVKFISSATGQMLPTAMGSCLPYQQGYPTDHRPGVFHPPVQPNLLYTREFSGYEASCSHNNLKRASCDEISPQSRPRGRKAQKSEPGQESMKVQRPVEQAEHIIRERQRRDDMTSKFLMLESMLPPGPKRDRSTVVEDSIEFVKSLHHRVKALNAKRSEMKLNAATATLSGMQTTDKQKQKTADQKLNPPADVRQEVLNAATNLKSCAGSKDNTASSPSESNALVKTCIEKVEVHLDLPHQIVIEMTCRPHPHIQSQILTALELLAMDVLRCSITKLHNRLLCVIVVKPRVITHPLITSDDVILSLKRATVADL